MHDARCCLISDRAQTRAGMCNRFGSIPCCVSINTSKTEGDRKGVSSFFFSESVPSFCPRIGSKLRSAANQISDRTVGNSRKTIDSLEARRLQVDMVSGTVCEPSRGSDVSPTQTDQSAGTQKESLDHVLVVAHRGASAYRPEHVLAGYELAAMMGADYMEPDLVSTKDHVLVCRHEPNILLTTDVASRPEFASRRRTIVIDGVEETGFFVHDFTLAEIKTLRSIESIPNIRPRNTLYDGLYEIPTFRELLKLREELSERLGRTIGVMPETKHPSYHASIGLNLEEPLLADIRAFNLHEECVPQEARAGGSSVFAKSADSSGVTSPRIPRVWIQSFESTNLKRMRHELGSCLPHLFLMWTGDWIGGEHTYDTHYYRSPEGLKEVATFADAIGPEKSLLFTDANASPTSAIEPIAEDPPSASEIAVALAHAGEVLPPPTSSSVASSSTSASASVSNASPSISSVYMAPIPRPTASSLVKDAHDAGLLVIPYNFRAENAYLFERYRSKGGPHDFGRSVEEQRDAMLTGIDGIFTDHPDIARIAKGLR